MEQVRAMLQSRTLRITKGRPFAGNSSCVVAATKSTSGASTLS